MEVRRQVAEFLSALISVYGLLLVGWVIVSLVFSLGVRVPYSRPLNAVLDFLRDVSEPYLRVFRRFGLRFGPFDLTPMVALFVLYLGGQLVVSLIAP